MEMKDRVTQQAKEESGKFPDRIDNHLTITKKDYSKENQILTGMIVSGDFLGRVLPIFNPECFETPYAQLVSEWCMDFHREYGKAPKGHIQDLFNKWKEDTPDEDFSDLLDTFLSNLSTKYEDSGEINADFLLDQAKNFFRQQKLKNLSDEIKTCIQDGREEDAERLIEQYQRVSHTRDSLISEIEECAVTSTDFFQQDIKRPPFIIWPVITEGSLTMIYGPAGIGKTWLTYAMALGVTRKNFDELEIGTWQFRKQAGVLLIDGEMHKGEIHERLKRLAGPLGDESRDFPLTILSANAMGEKHGRQLSINDKEWREAVTAYLVKYPHLKILILDNIASLSPGIDENVKNEWDPINQWLLSLRHLGIAVILVHHANKANQQRGTSGRADNLDNILKLSPTDSAVEEGACFKVTFEKGRMLKAGEKIPFIMRIREHETKPAWLVWTVENERVSNTELIAAMIMDGELSQADIARKIGVSRPRVSAVNRQAKKSGWMNDDGKPTDKGLSLVERLRPHLDELYGE